MIRSSAVLAVIKKRNSSQSFYVNLYLNDPSFAFETVNFSGSLPSAIKLSNWAEISGANLRSTIASIFLAPVSALVQEATMSSITALLNSNIFKNYILIRG